MKRILSTPIAVVLISSLILLAMLLPSACKTGAGPATSGDPVYDGLPAASLVADSITAAGLTPGSVPVTGAGGLLTADENLMFTDDTLTVTNVEAETVAASSLTPGSVLLTGEDGVLTDDSDLSFSGDTLTVSSLNAPTGRTASYVIAAADATVREKAHADKVCTGVNDASDIVTWITALGNNISVKFSDSGTFNLEKKLLLHGVDGLTFQGGHFKVNDAISTTLSTGASAGATSITVTDASGLVIGQDIYIGVSNSISALYHIDDTPSAPYWCEQREVQPGGESNIITNIVGNILTLNYALTNSYLASADVVTYYDAMYFDVCDDLRVLKVTLDGNRSNQVIGKDSGTLGGDIFQNGIRLSGCNNPEVAGCTVHDVVYNHIMVHPNICPRIKIHDNTVYTATVSGDNTQTRGIVVEGGLSLPSITSNQVDGLEIGVYSVGDEPSISGNVIRNSVQYGVSMNASVKFIINNNQVDCGIKHGGACISISTGCNTGTVCNNDLFYGKHGIDIRGSNIAVSNNTINQPSQNGIYTYGCTYCTFNDNTIKDGSYTGTNTNSAILLRATSTDNRFNDNYIFQTAAIKYKYAIEIESTCGANKFLDNDLNDYDLVPVLDAAAGNVFDENINYIACGEIRTFSGTIATLTQNAFNSVDNPFGQSVKVLDLQINVTTGAAATAPNIDCGIGTSATVDYATLFDDLPGETPGFYKSTVATPGTQTVPVLWQSGSGSRYLNLSIKDAAATGMVATYTVTVMGY